MASEAELVCTIEPKCLWMPSDPAVRSTNMDRLRQIIEKKYDVRLSMSLLLLQF